MSENKAANRKDTHLDLARKTQVESDESHHFLDRVELPYCALPEMTLEAVDIRTRFLGRQMAAPLMITGMTGGTPRADALNAALVAVASDHQIAVGLGSQRASLEAGRSQAALRKNNPKACLIGNLGGVQIVGEAGLARAIRAVEDIEADALAIHLNPLQEIIQPEGEKAWQGIEEAIARIVDRLPCPVIVKEVGAGLSAEVVRRLYAAGVRTVDLAARGGTNWARIEWMRQTTKNQTLYRPFLDIGIPLPTAITQARTAVPDMQLIASGGVRHGLDVAKTLYLGADIAGMAGGMLRALEDQNKTLHPNRLADKITEVKTQIRLACFLTASKSIKGLKNP